MITYVKGDATAPLGDGPKIIAHICNDVGGWGAGFVVAISKRWPEPEEAYRAWAKGRFRPRPGCAIIGPQTFALGSVQFVSVAPQLAVANMIAQRGYGARGNAPHKTEDDDPAQPPIRYEALALCLSAVKQASLKLGSSIHMPRIGTGLAGGKWERIEPLIERVLAGREVTVYDWDPKH